MQIRKVSHHELDTIYLMGFDVWGEGLSRDEYLAGCQSSKKYQSGVWYVLSMKSRSLPLSSIATYLASARVVLVSAPWQRIRR